MKSKAEVAPYAAGTLGAVLYADPSRPGRPEAEWVALVGGAAAESPGAVLELYDRTHRAVFTLLARLTHSREIAEAIALDLYADLPGLAEKYDALEGTVLAWIMNVARARAIERLRRDQARHLARGPSDKALLVIDMPDYRHILHFRDEQRRLQTAVAALAPEEREAIEGTYFVSRTCVDAASALGRPAHEVASHLRGGLRKLAYSLGVPVGEDARCPQSPLAHARALQAIAPAEEAALQGHLSHCTACRRDLEAARTVVAAFYAWPTHLLRPVESLRARLADRLGAVATPCAWTEPDWHDVAPGIFCQLLARDDVKQVISMLVRLVPDGAYPAHSHAATEELHLLHGELWIDERKLHAGDYNRAERGTGDKRVWSETGCACVLVTSMEDILA